ncbi:MICOS complex subunit MIC10 [Taenia solium]|eukprot:TsM_000671900 transcript=TsM_000671900 gene=TsM_000671900
MNSHENSEDIMGRKVDRCISDVLIKTGRPWPLIFGIGFGLGMGISNCNSEFKQPLPLQSHIIKAQKKSD